MLKVLHVAGTFYPATRWGGPTFSTKAICDWVAAQPGVDLRVLTTNAAGPAVGDDLDLDGPTLHMAAGYAVTYHKRRAGRSVAPGLLTALPGAVRWADVVHLTATYSFPSLPTLAIARALNRPVVWSLRGAVQAAAEWEDAPRQGGKKAFERAARLLAPRVTVVHTTAKAEARASATRLPGMTFDVIPNSVDVPETLPVKRPAPQGQTRLMFMSRLHEKKGLSLLISAMAGLPDRVALDIYGTGEADYLATLKAEIEQAGLSGRVRFHGHVSGADKSAAFAGADLFVLPSYSENFGIVVAEALAHGVPVLTTDRTPWQDLERRGAGRSIAPAVDPLRAALMEMSAQDLSAMGAFGRRWMIETYAPDAVHPKMLALYEAARAAQAGHHPLHWGQHDTGVTRRHERMIGEEQ